MKQLPLNLHWLDYATFANFFIGDNREAVTYLQNLWVMPERSVYLYGNAGSGLSHLLQACCQMATEHGKTAAYLSLQRPEFSPEILDGLEQLDLLCIDDVQVIAGQRPWEESLFHLYNRVLSSSAHLVIASQSTIKQLPWGLPDLASRLAASVIFQIKLLSDEQKIQALQQRAKVRGLELPQEVGRFLLNHFPRDMPALFAALEQLDLASLAAGRRLTVPFVKEVLIAR